MKIIQTQPPWQPRPPADTRVSTPVCAAFFRQKNAEKEWDALKYAHGLG